MPTDERITGVIEFPTYKALDDDELCELRSVRKTLNGSHTQVVLIDRPAAVILYTELRHWLEKTKP